MAVALRPSMLRSWPMLLLLSCLCLPGRAGAFALLPVAGGTVQTEGLRLVVAAHQERSTLWGEWMLRVTGERFVMLVPLVSEATLDMADPAWFEAIEHATAPRILPPVDVALEECGASPGVHDTSSQARAEPGFPRAVTLLGDDTELAEFLAREGLELAEPVSFAGFGNPEALVALEYAPPPGAPVLVDLRLQAALSPDAWLDRVAPIEQKQQALVTLTVLAETPYMIDRDDVVFSHELDTIWRAKSGDSDYPEARSRLLADDPEAWVTEVVGATHVFEPYYPDARGMVPAVVEGFRNRLAERGYECPDWSEWLAAARAGDGVAPEACASGELASLGAPECPLDPRSANPLFCEGIFDLALALSGARLNDVVLTRHVGRLAAACTLAPDPTLESHTVKVYADSVASSECPSGGAGGESASGGSGGSADGAGGGSGGASTTRDASGNGFGFGGGWSGGPNATTSTPDASPPRDIDGGEVVVYVDSDSCSCRDTCQDDCSGDSSSSSDDGSCSGDSSSDTSDGEATCDGDSSESSGDTCSGDSSADVEGDTCSGASEGGDATCASGGSGEGCAVGRFGFPRPRLSVVTLVLGAGLLPWRRRHRRRRARPST